jgi:arylsulfatase A-like enzyme
MNRHLTACLVTAACLSGCGGDTVTIPEIAVHPQLAATPRANVVLISIDTLRADHIHTYGYERETSPYLDAFAEQSVLFEQAYANSNNTGPSHMTIFTGVLPETHRVDHSAINSLAPGVPFLTEVLKNAGYKTAAFADGGFVNEALGFGRGFDHFESKFEAFGHKLNRIEDWIEEAPNEPTFLFVHTYGVHAPYVPLPEYDVYSADYDGILRERLELLLPLKQAMHEGNSKHDQVEILAVAQQKFWEGKENFNERDVKYLKDLYDGCIREVDAGFNRLLASLEAKGWLENSWVIVLSDHGEAFNEHGTFAHRGLFSEELHVPLIIRPPGGLDEGIRRPEVVGLIDVPQTILSSLDMAAPIGMQGEAVFPLAALSSRSVHSTAGESYGYSTFISGDHKLVFQQYKPSGLFDLGADPLELDDIFESPTAQQVVNDLSTGAANTIESANQLRDELGSPAEAGELSAEQMGELGALGYLDDDQEKAPGRVKAEEVEK